MGARGGSEASSSDDRCAHERRRECVRGDGCAASDRELRGFAQFKDRRWSHEAYVEHSQPGARGAAAERRGRAKSRAQIAPMYSPMSPALMAVAAMPIARPTRPPGLWPRSAATTSAQLREHA